MQAVSLFVGDIDQDVSETAELSEAFDVGCSSSDLRQFGIEGLLHFVASFLMSSERFEWFRQGVSRNDKPYVTCFAKVNDFKTAGVLFLEQGNFQDEVRFNVDVHATA